MERFTSTEGEKGIGMDQLYLKPPLALINGGNGMRGALGGDDCFSLELSLGCGSRSFTSTDGSVSAGCGNLFNADSEHLLHLGNDLTPGASIITSPVEAIQGLELDLTLSLSSEPPKSAITNSVSMFSHQLVRNIDAGVDSCSSTIQLVDEGSTSGKWNVAHLGPPLSVTHALYPAVLQSSCMDTDLPPSAVSTLPATLSTQFTVVSGVVESVQIQKQQKAKARICQVVGCGRGARGASGRCISHGGGRRCERVGCLKGAEGRTVFCKAHGGGRRCEHLGCTKTAEGRTDFCIAHGGGRRCTHDGCTHASRGKSGLCIRHGGGKRCQKEDCTKSAEGSSGFCISHGGGRRCQKLGCTKGAQGSTMYCKGHGGGKRCTSLGCMKGAEGSTQFCKGHGGGKRCSFGGGGVCPKSVHGGTLFCVRHGGGKRCATPGCTKSARGRTSHCVRHGGGKRCQHEGCTKSAQGRTDFCKAHGGGKRCSWLPSCSVTNNQASSPCNKFPRDKSGLCALHITLSEDKRVHGGDLLGPNLPTLATCPSTNLKECETSSISQSHNRNSVADISHSVSGYNSPQAFMQFTPENNFQTNIGDLSQYPVPEGRVHGGNIMKLPRGNLVSSSNNSKLLKTQLNFLEYCPRQMQ